MTGFYMMATLAFNKLRKKRKHTQTTLLSSTCMPKTYHFEKISFGMNEPQHDS